MTTLPAVAVYNQGRMKDADLVATFVARREVLAALVNGLRAQAAGAAPEHQILIGVRGMGKTTLLRRLAVDIRGDETLAGHFLPLTFREEQYNVIGLDALWRNCAESLAEWCEQNDRADLAARLDRAVDSPDWHDPDTAAEGFLAACREIGRRPVLLIDNLDLILDALEDSDKKTGERSLWQLRSVLQASDGPLVIGAATEFLAQTGDREAAFYEFFHPHVLEPLTTRELFACLHALADLRQKAGEPVKAILAREPARLRTLYTLTGGNPRVLVLIYQLLERAESDTVFADLDALLDQVTPLYKARVEEYQTAQQRAVIDAIALNWDPITARRISEITGIEQTTLPGQLNRLRKTGFVEEVETSIGRAGFQIAERFLNIWYLMRHGTRKTRQKLRWLTRLLCHLYTPDDLSRMAAEVQDPALAERMHPHYREALLAAVEESRRLSQGITGANEQPEVSGEDAALIRAAAALLRNGVDAFKNGQFEDALAAYNEFIERFGNFDQPAIQGLVAIALVNKGAALAHLGRSEDAIVVNDDVLDRCGASDQPALQEPLAMALVNKGFALGRLGRSEDAIAACDDVLARFGASDQPALQDQMARALVQKGVRLGQMGRSEDAIAAYDDVVARFGTSDQSTQQEQVARALFNKGVRLGQLGRSADAIAACDDVVARFGTSDQPALQEQVARALVQKGVRLGQMGRSEDAIAAHDDVVARFGASEQPNLREEVAWALVDKGATLVEMGREEDAIAAYDDVVARFGTSEQPNLREEVAWALLHKGFVLGQLGHSEDEIAAYDDVVARLGGSDEAALQNQVAMALVNKGGALGQLGRSKDAIAACDDVVARFGASDDPALRAKVDRALSTKGEVLHDHFADLAGAEAAWRRARDMDMPFSGGTYHLIWLLLSQGRLDEADAVRPASDPEHLDPVDDVLIDAGFALAHDNLGTAMEHLADALDAGLEREHGQVQDVLPLLRLAEAKGYADKVIDWFETSGNADKYSPVHAAFVAYVHGEERLRDVNPEVRAPAKDLYDTLDAPRRALAKRQGRDPDAPSKSAKPTKRRRKR